MFNVKENSVPKIILSHYPIQIKEVKFQLIHKACVVLMFCFRIAMTEKEQTTSSSKLGGLWGYFSNPLNTASSSMWSGGLLSDPSSFWKWMPWIKNVWYTDPSPILNCVFCLPQLPQDWEENVVTDKSCYVIFGRNFVRKSLYFLPLS